MKESIKSTFGSSHPSIDNVHDQYLGTESSIHSLFRREIIKFNNYKLFLRFVGTFFFLAWYDSSISILLIRMLYNKKISDLIRNSFTSHQQCNSLWNKIAEARLGKIRMPNLDMSINFGIKPF